MDGLQPKSEREILLVLSQRVDTLAENTERIITAIESLEKVKFDALEKRVSKVERNERVLFGVALTIQFLVALYAAARH